jgi:negative regulator of replication initiation
MGRTYHLNVKIDQELYRALASHAERAALNMSEATRDLLRHALATVTSPDQSIVIEAQNRAIAQVKRAVNQAIGQLGKPDDE